jgi:hypothetical protein
MEILIVVVGVVFVIWCGLKICGIPVSFNVLPVFLVEEKVLFFKRWVWTSSGKSQPIYYGYRLLFSLPPLLENGLYITDRRVLHVCYLFRIIKCEFSQWFEGKQEPPDNELVRDTSCGKSLLLGPYLDIVSENLVKQWFRPPHVPVRIRLYMREPAFVCQIISEAMRKIEHREDGAVL